MSEFTLIAKASGCCIYKKEDLLVVKEQPSSWISTARFVFLLLSGIPFIFGIIQLIMFLRGSETPLLVGIILILVGIVFGIAFWLLNRFASKINALPPSELRSLCSFDLKNHVLLDSSGNELDTLKNTRVELNFQLTSSSKKLVVLYSKGSILLAKGNTFAGGTAPLESIFRSEGLMK